jgi:hypothetical protein
MPDVKLEPGWLTRDVNNAAERAKSLQASKSSPASRAPGQAPITPPQNPPSKSES